MREMKNSESEWIGLIPSSWEIVRIGKLFTLRNDKNYLPENKVQLLSLYTGKGVFPTKESEYQSGNHAQTVEGYKIVKKNDIVVNIILAWMGALGISEYDGVCSPAYDVYIPNKDKVVPHYYHYVFRTSGIAGQCYKYGRGIMMMRWRTYSDEFKQINVPFPPVEFQKAIADYLDKKCSEIDALTKDIEKQIEVLEDYKKSVITEAVTKGLNPNVEMKDSGVEWIGSCPKNWDIIPFKYCLKERNEKNNPVKTDERLSLSIDKGVTLYSEKTTNLDRFKDDVSQYKIAHQGDFVLNSMNMIVGAVGISNYYGCVSPAYYVYYDELDNHISAKYCNYLFSSKPMRKVLFSLGKGIMAIDRGDDQINTCRLKVSRYDMLHLSMPWPTYCEQKKIVEQLDLKCSEISALILDKQKQLEILADYKKSLIYEYVTGKKEVIA